MPITPDFSALEAVITAKVESVATNIDNKDLLIQMKALEAAVANLALTRVITEGTYQQGQVTLSANNAIDTIDTTVGSATTTLNSLVTTAAGNLNDAVDAALEDFNTTSTEVLNQINDLLDQLGSVNTQDIIDLVTQSLLDISSAADAASDAITQLQQDAVGVISQTGTTAVDDVNQSKSDALDAVSGAQTSAVSSINTARDQAILAVGASSDLSSQIRLIRDDRWLGLDIFAPTTL